ncbi:hypothetical protein HMPREF9445_00599 [Bacteroides clarus YIT 12056]|jgi:hypothetical protein|uniref:Uncharacterized protein n=1 Tax=Bacteroides clarus YIT 12056 TaxID=762984 RepID=A0ABN0CRS8_9BACE|nr:hypothetical protein [Bacteroides clarus]EGF54250.1 hypothetical protein HMPREF9445_00599 [Bacteroides clarus YIT 12056]
MTCTEVAVGVAGDEWGERNKGSKIRTKIKAEMKDKDRETEKRE